jgi:phage terminase large subunit
MHLIAEVPAIFEPLLHPARYKGAWGGRGSGKSHFFAWQAIKRCMVKPGSRIVAIREIQNTLKESSKRLIEDKLRLHGLGQGQGFRTLHDCIETPGGGVIVFQGMQDSNNENIKSLEGFDVAWVEEAQTLSSRSLALLRPTIRKPGSELWFSWNARRKTDAVDVLLRGAELPTGAVVVNANWRHNPFFPDTLEQERLDCLRLEPEQYDHIWEGAYISILTGAYFAKHLAAARVENRIGRVGADPLLPFKLAIDIGGTGARADAFTIWVFQNVGKEARILNYYEAVGQPVGSHLEWLRENKYTPARCQVYLPHDGSTNDRVFDVSYESAFQAAGYDVEVIPNQGRAAAASRIEIARRIFPSCWFNEETTAGGIEALGWYHEKKDETRGIGLGPEHDWASHGADSFGLLCLVTEQNNTLGAWRSGKLDYSQLDRLPK